MRKKLFALVTFPLLLATGSQAAEPAKIELHVLRTTTLTDEQFLTGVKEGQPATIAALANRSRRTWARSRPLVPRIRDRP
jgi:hypothetical protein